MLDHALGFASISRHPEEGRDCRICEAGSAGLCVDCFFGDAVAMRSESPYRPVTLEEFEEQERRADRDRDHVAAMNREIPDTHAISLFDRTPAPAGPSWYRQVIMR